MYIYYLSLDISQCYVMELGYGELCAYRKENGFYVWEEEKEQREEQ